MKSWKQAAPLLFGIGFSNLGNWIYFVALNLTVLKMTASPAAVAGLFVLRPIAMLATNLWSGSLIDRMNPRKTMIMADVARGLLVLSIPFLPSVWPVYAVILVIQMFGSFFGPSSSVYMTRTVPAADRQRFNAVMSSMNSGAFLLGPALSGLLIVAVNADFCIYFNAFSFFVCAFILYRLPDAEGEAAQARSRLTLRVLSDDWREVRRFLRSAGYFAGLFILFQLAMVIGFAIDSQEATFIRLLLRLSEDQYGYLVSLTGAGALAGSLVAAAAAKRVSYRWYFGIGTLLTSAFYAAFYASHSFAVAAAAFVLLGFAMSFANSGYATLFQTHVPVRVMGRFASLSDLAQALIQIGLTLAVGLLAESDDLRLVCFGSACAATGLSLLLALRVFARSKNSFYADASQRTQSG